MLSEDITLPHMHHSQNYKAQIAIHSPPVSPDIYVEVITIVKGVFDVTEKRHLSSTSHVLMLEQSLRVYLEGLKIYSTSCIGTISFDDTLIVFSFGGVMCEIALNYSDKTLGNIEPFITWGSTKRPNKECNGVFVKKIFTKDVISFTGYVHAESDDISQAPTFKLYTLDTTADYGVSTQIIPILSYLDDSNKSWCLSLKDFSIQRTTPVDTSCEDGRYDKINHSDTEGTRPEHAEFPYLSKNFLNDANIMFKNLINSFLGVLGVTNEGGYSYYHQLPTLEYYNTRNGGRYKPRCTLERKWPDDYTASDGISNHFTEKERMRCKKYSKKFSPFDMWNTLDAATQTSLLSKGTLFANDYLYEFICNSFNPFFYIWIMCLTILKEKNVGEVCVLDPSAGWGDRLIAAMACGIQEYRGTDPNIDLQPCYNAIVSKFSEISTGKFEVLPSSFETSNPLENYYDICITSPPYYVLEEYAHSEKDKMMTYGEWIDKVYKPYLDVLYNSIKFGGWIVLYIEDFSLGDLPHVPIPAPSSNAHDRHPRNNTTSKRSNNTRPKSHIHNFRKDTIDIYKNYPNMKRYDDIGLHVLPSKVIRRAIVWKKISGARTPPGIPPHIQSSDIISYNYPNGDDYPSNCEYNPVKGSGCPVECDTIVENELISYNDLSPHIFASYFPVKKRDGTPVDTPTLEKLSLVRSSIYSTSPHSEIISYGGWMAGIMRKANLSLKNVVVTDATANVGGDTMGFWEMGVRNVISVEIDPAVYSVLRSNMEVLGYETRYIKNQDFVDIYRLCKQDVVYMDPPWGGKEYKKFESMELYIGRCTVFDIVKDIITGRMCKCLFLKVPVNYNFGRVSIFARDNGWCEDHIPIYRYYYSKKYRKNVRYVSYKILGYYSRF